IIVTASHIHKAYGADIILDDVTMTIRNRQCVALVGPNGAGKSTLLKIIAGDLSYDKGDVHLSKDCTVGYLSQHSSVECGRTVYEEVRSVYEDIFVIE